MNRPVKSERRCLAGPFVGEFGWELFCWQGFLRKRRPEFDHMTVISRPGRGVLYEDFADEFIEVDVPFDQVNMWRGGVPVEPIVSYHRQQGRFTDFIPFDSYKTRWWLDKDAQTKQIFKPYGRNWSHYRPVDILIHVRDAHHCGSTFRNWRVLSAVEYSEWVLKKGYSIACVGKKETSISLPGTFDYRSIPLYDEFDLFANSGVIIGSQSGPHHLAALCQLPVIAWQTRPEHVPRLTKHWNPFNVKMWTNCPKDNSYWDNKTKNTKHWQPSLEWMQKCTVEALKLKR